MALRPTIFRAEDVPAKNPRRETGWGDHAPYLCLICGTTIPTGTRNIVGRADGRIVGMACPEHSVIDCQRRYDSAVAGGHLSVYRHDDCPGVDTCQSRT